MPTLSLSDSNPARQQSAPPCFPIGNVQNMMAASKTNVYEGHTIANPAWEIFEGSGPVVAVALHDGHDIREELLPWLVISDADRLREEDPYTGAWTTIAPSRVVVRRSRFEVDLNRPIKRAVYLRPQDCWELTVWNESLPEDVVARSRAVHSDFYSAIEKLLNRLVDEHGQVIVYELHSYNHHRQGPDAAFDNPDENPQMNLGTAHNSPHWRPVLDRFKEDLRNYDFLGGQLEVAENVKFTGGYFSRWLGEKFPDTVCNLCIEFKKFFMDEWTGELYDDLHTAIKTALESTVPGVLEELKRL